MIHSSTRCSSITCRNKCKWSIFHFSHHTIPIHPFISTTLNDYCSSLIMECEHNYELLPANTALHSCPAPFFDTHNGTTVRSKQGWQGQGVIAVLLVVSTLSERLYTLQSVCVCEGEWAATAGSGRFWSSGCQNRPPRHVRRRWEPAPEGRTEGLLMCWCTTGRSRCRRTPGRWKYHITVFT